ncbi:MAG: deoxyribodipyrimidine photo-lyase, partial [Actinobacteria bacterium]|nr:deoxyribodipyrimidine photo-lyase [Actinomycetota bacterium]
MMTSTAIVWLRRDLRVHDHPALARAACEHAFVVPVFVLDERLLTGRFASAPRAAFLRGCLEELDGELAARGGGLVVRSGRPEEVIPALARETGAAEVLWTSDVSAFALARDRRVRALLEEEGIAATPCPGNYCADVGIPRTKTGKPFTVFTPFRNVQRELPRRPVEPAPAAICLPAGIERGTLPS